jgi:hypothetical protein
VGFGLANHKKKLVTAPALLSVGRPLLANNNRQPCALLFTHTTQTPLFLLTKSAKDKSLSPHAKNRRKNFLHGVSRKN